MSRTALISLFFLLFFATACNPGKDDLERIYLTLDKRWTAINTKDRQLFTDTIADDYPDRQKVLITFQLNRQYFKDIRYTQRARSIDSYNPFSHTVVVEQTFDLSFTKPDEETPTLLVDRKEKITLRKYGNNWKIFSGLK